MQKSVTKSDTFGHCLRVKPFVTFALRLFNCYNYAHAPGQYMWPSQGPGPDSKGSKTVEVRCPCQELKLCQCDTDVIPAKQKLKRAQWYKNKHVSAMKDSVQAKLLFGWRKSMDCERLEPMFCDILRLSLTTETFVHIVTLKIIEYVCSILQPWNNFMCAE